MVLILSIMGIVVKYYGVGWINVYFFKLCNCMWSCVIVCGDDCCLRILRNCNFDISF